MIRKVEMGVVCSLQVDIIQTEFLQTYVESFRDIVDAMVDFGDHEKLFPGNLAIFDALSHFCLVLVGFGPVEVSESDLAWQ